MELGQSLHQQRHEAMTQQAIFDIKVRDIVVALIQRPLIQRRQPVMSETEQAVIDVKVRNFEVLPMQRQDASIIKWNKAKDITSRVPVSHCCHKGKVF